MVKKASSTIYRFFHIQNHFILPVNQLNGVRTRRDRSIKQLQSADRSQNLFIYLQETFVTKLRCVLRSTLKFARGNLKFRN